MSILRNLCVLALVGSLAACSTSLKRPAPVEDRTGGGVARPAAPTPGSSSASTRAGSGAAITPDPAPSTLNSGDAGTYTVQRGDTLAKIALDHGIGWPDLARWNGIDTPNLIEVGQVLRVTPPGDGAARPMVTRPLPPQAGRTVPAPMNASPASAPAAAPAPVASAPPAVTFEDAPAFAWPAQGNLIAGFDDARNKGLDIAGKPGDPVLAAADGRVVYAGAELRGYGNLIILKHNNTYLTAYAHNQSLLVKEDQEVRRGQKIAEMGNTDADQVKLHFEIRRQGKPVDPARLLPAR
ncbi:MAG: peptidoglycan DD-metalloendopeptidase family protein [Alphaproteobacteria bacterium]|nr:peptidoglycan DD-metalloendopeptidase family protein [Alphaproteobacteria bacterium]